jgi:hypothetical protein
MKSNTASMMSSSMSSVRIADVPIKKRPARRPAIVSHEGERSAGGQGRKGDACKTKIRFAHIKSISSSSEVAGVYLVILA